MLAPDTLDWLSVPAILAAWGVLAVIKIRDLMTAVEESG